jgi:nucleoside-diphosphate-sugar epimerase
MAVVAGGRVVIFGAGGPVGAAAIEALKENYTLRLTDVRPMAEISAQASVQGRRAPVPELLASPHENMVVDVSDYGQVERACQGMDAAINLTVLRPDLEKAFAVNMTGAYNIARAAVACGLKRLIHTGPFHTTLEHDADYWNDHRLVDDIPLHPGGDLYALTKYLGGEITRVFAERHGLEVLVFLFCGFRPRRIEPAERGKGSGPFIVSWEDAGESFLYGLRAAQMPSPYETFFICAKTPDRKHRVDKAKRLLGWEAKDTFEELLRKPPGP